MTDLLRTEPGERIDHDDFQTQAVDSQFSSALELLDQIFLGEDSEGQAGLRVISGFGVSGSGSTVLSVAKGRAIVGARGRDGVMQYAHVTAGGRSSRTIQLVGDGVFSVQVIFRLDANQPGNRIFWDAALVTPTETVRNIRTRHLAEWDVQLIRTSAQPTGATDGWMKIATIVVFGGVVSQIVMQRHFLFEGREDATVPFTLEDEDWGTPADREASAVGRVTSGIRGLVRFVPAMLRQMQDIVGDRWFTLPNDGTTAMNTPGIFTTTGAKSLIQLMLTKLDRGGDQPFLGRVGDVLGGALRPDVDNVADIGVVTKRWRRINGYVGNFANAVESSGSITATLDIVTTHGNLNVNSGHVFAADYMQALDYIQAEEFRSGSASNSALFGTLVRANTPLAWGEVLGNPVHLNLGFNCSVSVAGFNALVTLNGIPSGTNFTVVLGDIDLGVFSIHHAANRNTVASTFEIATRSSPPLFLPSNWTTSSIGCAFIVFAVP